MALVMRTMRRLRSTFAQRRAQISPHLRPANRASRTIASSGPRMHGRAASSAFFSSAESARGSGRSCLGARILRRSSGGRSIRKLASSRVSLTVQSIWFTVSEQYPSSTSEST